MEVKAMTDQTPNSKIAKILDDYAMPIKLPDSSRTALVKALQDYFLSCLPSKQSIDYLPGYSGNRLGEAKSEAYNLAINRTRANIKKIGGE